MSNKMPRELKKGLEGYNNVENGFYYRQGYYRCWNIVKSIDSVANLGSLDASLWDRIGTVVAYVLQTGKNKVG